MSSPARPTWSGAQWVGLVELDVLDELFARSGDAPPTIALDAAEGYDRARLLVRAHDQVRGFIELEIHDGRLDAEQARRAALALPVPAPLPPSTARPTVSVVLCTRDRADQLALALESVRGLDYPELEIVVVDNASSTTATADYLRTLDDPRVVAVVEPRAGLARARNTGLRHAHGEIVAFTDDDVVVDPAWIARIVDGFARAADVACVTGLVPSGELREPVQAHFDQRVSWANSCEPAQFRLSAPPVGAPLFPFQVGVYGTGANFALRRSTAFALGGFDEALGVGRPTGGGEDIDMFVRVIAAGHAIAYEPSALIWHRHRCDMDALSVQAIGYGIGLGAWLTKVALDRRLLALAVRRAVGAGRRFKALGDELDSATDLSIDPALREVLAGIGRAERRAVLRGPWRYLKARRTSPSRPLRATEVTG